MLQDCSHLLHTDSDSAMSGPLSSHSSSGPPKLPPSVTHHSILVRFASEPFPLQVPSRYLFLSRSAESKSFFLLLLASLKTERSSCRKAEITRIQPVVGKETDVQRISE